VYPTTGARARKSFIEIIFFFILLLFFNFFFLSGCLSTPSTCCQWPT
jgi:hypothetical protein